MCSQVPGLGLQLLVLCPPAALYSGISSLFVIIHTSSHHREVPPRAASRTRRGRPSPTCASMVGCVDFTMMFCAAYEMLMNMMCSKHLSSLSAQRSFGCLRSLSTFALLCSALASQCFALLALVVMVSFAHAVLEGLRSRVPSTMPQRENSGKSARYTACEGNDNACERIE